MRYDPGVWIDYLLLDFVDLPSSRGFDSLPLLNLQFECSSTEFESWSELVEKIK